MAHGFCGSTFWTGRLNASWNSVRGSSCRFAFLAGAGAPGHASTAASSAAVERWRSPFALSPLPPRFRSGASRCSYPPLLLVSHLGGVMQPLVAYELAAAAVLATGLGSLAPSTEEVKINIRKIET